MLKQIKNLEGAEKLTKSMQNEIKGGGAPTDGESCPSGTKQCTPHGACIPNSVKCPGK